jgi:hypothetical protein
MYIHALVHNLYKHEQSPSEIQAKPVWGGDEFLVRLIDAKCDNVNTCCAACCPMYFIESWLI